MEKTKNSLFNLFITGLLSIFTGVLLSILYNEVEQGTLCIVIRTLIILGVSLLITTGVFLIILSKKE